MLEVDVPHQELGAPLVIEFIYLHGLVLQGTSLVYPKMTIMKFDINKLSKDIVGVKTGGSRVGGPELCV